MENQASLHYARLPAQPRDGCLERWLSRLPAEKRAAIERLRDPADRLRSVLGIALLASVLRARGLAFDPGALEYPVRGKPRLRDAPEFSIAHADGLVACAVSVRGRVGLDLERRGAVRLEQLRLVLDATERAGVASRALDATDAWVMKEAVAKAAGRGIEAIRGVALRGAWAALDGDAFALLRVDLAPTHAAWLALEADACVTGPDLVERDAHDALALPARR